jgi:hypothetical protein
MKKTSNLRHLHLNKIQLLVKIKVQIYNLFIEEQMTLI